MFKIVNHTAKINIALQYIRDVHNNPTRTRDLLVIRHSKTVFGYSNFFLRGFDTFNQLPPSIKNQISIK